MVTFSRRNNFQFQSAFLLRNRFRCEHAFTCLVANSGMLKGDTITSLNMVTVCTWYGQIFSQLWKVKKDKNWNNLSWNPRNDLYIYLIQIHASHKAFSEKALRLFLIKIAELY